MDPEDAWALLARDRRTFADLLDTLTPEQWENPSLCDRWSVREVATHMMVGPTGSLPGFATAMAMTRRPHRLDELSGEGAEALRGWALRSSTRGR